MFRTSSLPGTPHIHQVYNVPRPSWRCVHRGPARGDRWPAGCAWRESADDGDFTGGIPPAVADSAAAFPARPARAGAGTAPLRRSGGEKTRTGLIQICCFLPAHGIPLFGHEDLSSRQQRTKPRKCSPPARGRSSAHRPVPIIIQGGGRSSTGSPSSLGHACGFGHAVLQETWWRNALPGSESRVEVYPRPLRSTASKG